MKRASISPPDMFPGRYLTQDQVPTSPSALAQAFQLCVATGPCSWQHPSQCFTSKHHYQILRPVPYRPNTFCFMLNRGKKPETIGSLCWKYRLGRCTREKGGERIPFYFVLPFQLIGAVLQRSGFNTSKAWAKGSSSYLCCTQCSCFCCLPLLAKSHPAATWDQQSAPSGPEPLSSAERMITNRCHLLSLITNLNNNSTNHFIFPNN